MKRLGLLLGVLLTAAMFAGCSAGAAAAGAVGGCEAGPGFSNQFRTYARSWSNDMYRQQAFIDQYFLGYDHNDPYRCDCPIYDYCDVYGGGCR